MRSVTAGGQPDERIGNESVRSGVLSGGEQLCPQNGYRGNVSKRHFHVLTLALSAVALCGCEGLAVRNASSLLVPTLQHAEVVGIVAGLGTTLAAVPDLITMLKRRSSRGMNPRMAAIIGVSQIIWVYYGLLIESRPVVAWNVLAVAINFLSVAAYLHFTRSEKKSAAVQRH